MHNYNSGEPASSPARVVRGRDSEAPPGREAPRPGHDSRVARVRLSQTGPARTAERIVGTTMSAVGGIPLTKPRDRETATTRIAVSTRVPSYGPRATNTAHTTHPVTRVTTGTEGHTVDTRPHRGHDGHADTRHTTARVTGGVSTILIFHPIQYMRTKEPFSENGPLDSQSA